jgi:hypothetical protein
MGHQTGIGRAEALDVNNKGKPGASRGRNATGPAGSAGLLNRRVSMRTNTKVLGALAIAGLVAAGGSAFTATSTIDSGQKSVGATGQNISGVDVKSVQYTVGEGDVTTAVAFDVTQVLTAGDTVTATIHGTDGTPAPSTNVKVCDKTVHDAVVSPPAASYTSLACSFGSSNPLSNVNRLDIVAS